MNNYKGSKGCILKFISSSDFIANTNELIQHTGATISNRDIWKPIGFQDDEEAELSNITIVKAFELPVIE
jgi:hypothetical protein